MYSDIIRFYLAPLINEQFYATFQYIVIVPNLSELSPSIALLTNMPEYNRPGGRGWGANTCSISFWKCVPEMIQESHFLFHTHTFSLPSLINKSKVKTDKEYAFLVNDR